MKVYIISSNQTLNNAIKYTLEIAFNYRELCGANPSIVAHHRRTHLVTNSLINCMLSNKKHLKTLNWRI